MSKDSKENPKIEEMFKSGAHFGYSRSRRHPSAAKYVLGTKNKGDVIDLSKTAALLGEAEEYLKTLAKTGRTVLLVGTKPEAKKLVQEMADRLSMPSVVERWVGGAITNFPEIKKRIALLAELKDKREKGEMDKYTKKERLLIDEKIKKMEKLFSGLSSMTKMPDAMFVVDSKKEHIAVAEAKQGGVTVISLSNTDCDLKGIKYPIIANDASISSIKFFTASLSAAYQDGAKS